MSNVTVTNKVTLTKKSSLASIKSSLKAEARKEPQKTDVLYLLLDESGSMRGERWEALKEAVKQLYRYKGDAAISITTFSNTLTIHNTPSKLDMSHELVNMAGGTTEMLGAIQVLIQQAEMITETTGNLRIILVSDGDASDASHEEIFAFIKGMEIKPVIDTVFISDSSYDPKYGDGYGAQLLKDIADLTGGLFFNTKTLRDLTTLFIGLSPERRQLAR